MPLRTKAILALGSSSLLRLDLSFYDPPIPWSNPLLTSAWLKNKIWMFYVLKLESNDLHLIWLESKITRQWPEIGFYKVLCMILGSLTCSKLDVFGDLFINDYLILVLYLLSILSALDLKHLSLARVFLKFGLLCVYHLPSFINV